MHQAPDSANRADGTEPDDAEASPEAPAAPEAPEAPAAAETAEAPAAAETAGGTGPAPAPAAAAPAPEPPPAAPAPPAGPPAPPPPAEAAPAAAPPPAPPTAPAAAAVPGPAVPGGPDVPAPAGPLLPDAPAAAPEAGRYRGSPWRLAGLWAAALLLGVVGGLNAGYRIQAERPPTPLPPLAQEKLAYPEEPAEPTAALTADEDLRVPFEGDLRERLVEPPDDSAEALPSRGRDGWMDLHDYALTFTEPDHMFSHLVETGARRVAETGWTQEEWRSVRVHLIQFREEALVHAPVFSRDQQGTMSAEELGGSSGTALPDGMTGRYYMWDTTYEEPGYYPYTEYVARVVAQRGDVVMDIWIVDYDNSISEKAVLKLAEAQWRLL